MSIWDSLDVRKNVEFTTLKMYEPPEKPILTITPNVVELTNAEVDAYSSSILTCHDLRHYRRRDFEFEFLPEVNIIFEKLLEEVYGFEDV